MDKTKLVHCTCASKYQDEHYGKGMRVTTPANKAQSAKRFEVRCTVCGKTHILGSL